MRALNLEFTSVKVVWRGEKLHIRLRGEFKEDTCQLGINQAPFVCNLIVNVFLERLPHFIAALQIRGKHRLDFLRVFYGSARAVLFRYVACDLAEQFFFSHNAAL